MDGERVEWNYYTPPTSETAAAIQFPLDERWQGRVINGYLRDAKLSRRPLPHSKEGGKP